MQRKPKKCKECGAYFKQYNSLQKYCSAPCAKKNAKPPKPKAKIKPVSDKRKKDKAIYQLERILFLRYPENQNCVIKGTYCTGKATTIEHSAGRKGYYDEWAKENGVTLFLDKRFWKPACNNCNLELENNPELSKIHQLSKIHGGRKL